MAGKERSDPNRRGNRKSKGPRTPQGKALWDAIKDALARDVLEDEDPREFEQHRQGFLNELAPVGPTETALAERIVSSSWRLKRVEYLETAVLDHLLEEETSNPLAKLAQSLLADGVDLMGNDPETNPKLAFGRTVFKDFSGDRIIERLQIREGQIEDDMFNAMHELERLQNARKQGTGRPPHTGG